MLRLLQKTLNILDDLALLHLGANYTTRATNILCIYMVNHMVAF